MALPDCQLLIRNMAYEKNYQKRFQKLPYELMAVKGKYFHAY
jgi:hypothetical protein